MLGRWLRHRHGTTVLAGLAAVLAVALLQVASLPLLERVGSQVFDVFQRAAPREPSAELSVRVVDIDEESIARLGQWPWPRTDLARLNRVLGQAGAKAVAYDIVFSEPDRTSPGRLGQRLGLGDRFAGLPDNDALFAGSMAEAPVINGLFLVRETRGRPVEPKAGIALYGSLPDRAVAQYAGAIQALPVLDAAAVGAGSLSLPGDADGIVRRAPLVALHGEQLVPSLSLEAVRVALGEETIVVRASDGSGETSGAPGAVADVRVGEIEIPTTDAGEMWVHYTPSTQALRIPAWKLLSGELTPAQVRAEVGGKIVFVGASATGLRDLVSTPLTDREPGVMVHAQAAEQMLLGEFLERPDWAPGLELFLVVLLGGTLALVLPRFGAAAGAALGAFGIAAVIGASWFAFDGRGYLLDPTYPVMAIALVYTIETVLGFYREERRRAYIHRAFDRYLSPEMVRQIASDPGKLELGGEEREMTVLMCDIRGFSRLSEQHSPKDVIAFLIEFLTPMSEILLARKATLDKYIGDAILAFWNAPLDNPDHFRDGARAALAMTAELDRLNREMPAAPGKVWPGEVRIGIGLNSGLCCVGNMGSRQRLSYTLIGDTVNVTSRLEGLTKGYGVPIIVGDDLAAHLGGFALLEIDGVRVVGRDAPETIFTLLGEEETAQSPAFAALRKGQAAFLAAYRAQDWTEAAKSLARLEDSYAAFGIAGLGALYRERIEALRKAPPGPGWDGVYQATSK